MAGGPDQPGPDDVRFDDVPDPDLQALSRAMAGRQGDPTLDYPGAFVSVRRVRPQGWNQPDLPFVYAFASNGQFLVYVVTHQQSDVLEEQAVPSLWSVRVLGAYEPGRIAPGLADGDPAPGEADADDDPEADDYIAGLTDHIGAEYSVVFMEVVRDIAADLGTTFDHLNAFISGHEVGHQFGLADLEGNPSVTLMDREDAGGPDSWRWREQEIQKMRQTSLP